MQPDDMLLQASAVFVAALAASAVGTALVRRWAIQSGLLDLPDNERRIHSDPTPNVGGLAIVAAAILVFAGWGVLGPATPFARPEVLSLTLGGVAMSAVGFWDDVRHLSAFRKLLAQVIVAVAVYLGGVQIVGLAVPQAWPPLVHETLTFVLTIGWMVGVTNAVNLIDGSDGVAGGVAFFAAVSLAVVFGVRGDLVGAAMSAAVAAAALGFLYHNFPPASIFMGDSGSLFLGFSLAGLGVITTHRGGTMVSLVIPIILLGVPLLDTSIAIARRYLRMGSIFSPDRGHIHHRLRDLGHSSRGVALLIYIACAGCGSLALLLAAPGRPTAIPVFAVGLVLLGVSVHRLRVPELDELGRVMGRGLQQRHVISHNVQLRAAAADLESAKDGRAIVEALDRAFKNSEFSRVEVWLLDAMGETLFRGRDDVVFPDGSGYRLSLSYEYLLNPEFEVEISFPLFRDFEQVGRLSLFRSAEGPRLFTDVRLVSVDLNRALVGAVLRCLVADPKISSLPKRSR